MKFRSLVSISSENVRENKQIAHNLSSPPDAKNYKGTIRRQEREGSPKCYHCDGDENITVEHFLLSCSKFEEIRSELLCQLRGELQAIGERGFQVWETFTASSPAFQSKIILGAQSFGAEEDEAINHFRTQYVARAWSERLVI
ncbi:uncharacterized protein LOC111338463 isoform X1 [Stylophora pistillata]|uniref:Uncharacterized protein n=1 Tax=Stylophora pistillata TaxID=50429 RepID=A0A2B4RR20_STYPI|nr:uncharacterized protein LOC111338463 isoform X1 [Stylophora pistillata]PFX19239.1 hypothetical protein AWC38_SpisGene16355 [Stylophora pistillata]